MLNILSIDDNKNNLFALESVLTTLPNLEVISVLSAQEGLLILLQQKIDLILLDVQMPEMDGFEAAKMIKANPKTKSIPIIFLTAIYHANKFKQKGFEAGAVEYLSKPIDDNKLLNKIKLYQRLIESEKQLLEQKAYLQNIIDLQQNILMVIENNKTIMVNRRFLEFTGYSSLDKFLKTHNCICDCFIRRDNFISIADIGKNIPATTSDITSSATDCYQLVKSDPQKIHLALMVKEKHEVILAVDAKPLSVKEGAFIFTLTDVSQMHEQKELFKHKALTDHLTGAFNRIKFDTELDSAINNINQKSFTLAMFDIDYFKKINDEFGHLVGDSVLKELVVLINKYIRGEDTLFRWGGEEFFLILFAPPNRVMKQLEQLRKVVENFSFTDVPRSITISIGYCEFNKTISRKSLLKFVDKALYHAKDSGRNCIKLSDNIIKP
jgi:diguanylate cyclase (GGDEF)-like protein